MKSFYKNIFMYLCFFLLFLIVNFFISPLYCDEVWNFGFSYNIYNGLVPYRDFNVIVTPFYFILNAFVFKIFSPNVFVMHVISAIFATISLYFIRKINQKSFCFIYVILIILGVFPFTPLFPGYNLFSLYLFIIIFVLNYENKSPFFIGLFTGILFTVKQTIGIFVFIPLLINIFKDFKAFLKGLIGFIIPIILLLLYLIYNNALFDFINYCFLGMFDFSKSNTILHFLFLEIIVICILIYKLITDKENFKSYLYLLCLQIVTYPIFDLGHLAIGFIPVIIFLTRNRCFNKFIKYIVTSILAFSVVIYILNDYDFTLKNYSKYFKYKNNKIDILAFHEIGEYIKNNSEDYDVHIISFNSYFTKLENDLPIDEFDLLNYGNLGYNSYNRYIDRINNNDRDMLFIISDKEYKVTQLHNEIIEYIIDNSIMIESNLWNYYNVYKFEVNK